MGILILGQKTKELRFNLKFQTRSTIQSLKASLEEFTQHYFRMCIFCLYTYTSDAHGDESDLCNQTSFHGNEDHFLKHCRPAPPDQCVRPGTANTTAQLTDERKCHHEAEGFYKILKHRMTPNK